MEGRGSDYKCMLYKRFNEISVKSSFGHLFDRKWIYCIRTDGSFNLEMLYGNCENCMLSVSLTTFRVMHTVGHLDYNGKNPTGVHSRFVYLAAANYG